MKSNLSSSILCSALLLFATVNSQCTGSINRICIETRQIQLNSPIPFYFPFTLFPVDIDISTLVIDLYQGSSSVLLPDPCSTTRISSASLASSSPLEGSVSRISSTVSASAISFRFTQKQASDLLSTLNTTNNAFFMRMADPNLRQCLLGPDVSGAYSDSVSIDIAQLQQIAATTTTSTTPTPTSTQTSTTNSREDALSIIRILVLCVVGGFILLATIVALCLWSSRRRKEKDEYLDSDEVATRRNNSEEFEAGGVKGAGVAVAGGAGVAGAGAGGIGTKDALRLPSLSSLEPGNLSPFPYHDRQDILPIDTYMAMSADSSESFPEDSAALVSFSENLTSSLNFHTPARSFPGIHTHTPPPNIRTPGLSDTQTLQGDVSNEEIKVVPFSTVTTTPLVSVAE